jgi:bifunctional DNA-binding transcriptional regulator/antitoxin component of YhaV-PrlF toxin-antitoxin module
MSMVSKIDHNSYTKIPDEIISQAGLKPGDDVIWFYDEHTKQIILMEKPLDFSKALRGLGKETWKNVDVEKYIQEERFMEITKNPQRNSAIPSVGPRLRAVLAHRPSSPDPPLFIRSFRMCYTILGQVTGYQG